MLLSNTLIRDKNAKKMLRGFFKLILWFTEVSWNQKLSVESWHSLIPPYDKNLANYDSHMIKQIASRSLWHTELRTCMCSQHVINWIAEISESITVFAIPEHVPAINSRIKSEPKGLLRYWLINLSRRQVGQSDKQLGSGLETRFERNNNVCKQ